MAFLLLFMTSCREPSGSLINTQDFITTTQPTGETTYSPETISASRILARYFNEHSNLDFQLLTPWDEIDELGRFKFIGGYGCHILSDDSHSTDYTFAGFPDMLDSFALISFNTSDESYNICGITCGMLSTDAENILAVLGLSKTDEGEHYKNFNLDGWGISLTVYDDIIIKISISFKSTNIKDVDF